MTDLRRQRIVGSGLRRQFDLRLAAGLALALAPLAVLVCVVAIGPPANDLTVAHPGNDTWVVASVPVGGPAWNGGVRPGMKVIGVEPVGTDPTIAWDTLLVTDGTLQISLPHRPLPPGSELAAVAAIAWLAAVVAAFWLPNVAWVLAMVSLAVTTLNVPILFDPPIDAALLLAGPLAGALFASETRRRRHPLVAVAAGGMVALVAAGWTVAELTRLDDWHTFAWLSVLGIVVSTSFGVAGVVHAAWLRARAQAGALGLGGTSILAPLADELVPGRARTRIAAIERERAQLAGELHADVLPDLSAVIREIDTGTTPEDAGRRLRAIAADLRDFMNERRLGVLDELGLMRALEWLAERVEERTGVTVELEILGVGQEDPELRPPREVELTVYRIAQQALDNALLHARPRLVRVCVDVSAGHVALELADDGVGMPADAEARALRAGHLGLADMRQRAAAIGAAFSIGPREGGGTQVAVRWQA